MNTKTTATHEPTLRRYSLGEGVVAFSTTRHGGYSHGNHGSFNVNEYCGDDPLAVANNRGLLCRELGIGEERLVMPHQTHGVEVRQIAGEFMALPPSTRKMLLEGVDAVMTDVERVCVGVSTADCMPILIYDPCHRACCAVHAGWRGTVAHIAARAVAAMAAAYHTEPSALRACIGPGISLEHFEVGDEVYGLFADAGFDMDKVARRHGKWHIDLWECNRIELCLAGLQPASVSVEGPCTYSHADDYFSARRLGTASGRIFTGIMIDKSQ